MILKTAEKHKNEARRAAPMAAAPIKYAADGTVDWENMWDTFCVLAQEGGPPHRGIMLTAAPNPDVQNPLYLEAAAEIIRGVELVSGLTAVNGAPGWIQLICDSPGMARWLSEAIVQENVAARHEGAMLFVPVSETFRLKEEIKSVITAVAKTTHYWEEHLAREVKQTLAVQDLLGRLAGWLRGR